MKKIVIIAGLTASGKSSLAVELAKKYNGEIISADSVQIYKGLNIGSAKESKKVREEIHHHLINIKNFDEKYNVGEFIVDCETAINQVFAKNKLPIIVGGTGLYLKALLEGYTLGSTSNNEIRTKYSEMAKEKGNLAVWYELAKLNQTKAKTVHYNNLKRVIRYIEIELMGETSSKTESILNNYNVCAVGIVEDRETIYQRIDNRVDQMIADGLEEEVSNLIKIGAKREMQAFNSIGYKEWFDYFEGTIDKRTTIDLIKQHTRNYCKRQLTFLKTINGVEMLKLDEAKNRIEEFLNDRT